MLRFVWTYSSDGEKEAADPDSEYTNSECRAASERVSISVLMNHLYLVLQPSSLRWASNFLNAKESIHLIQEVLKFKGNPLWPGRSTSSLHGHGELLNRVRRRMNFPEITHKKKKKQHLLQVLLLLLLGLVKKIVITLPSLNCYYYQMGRKAEKTHSMASQTSAFLLKCTE